MFQTLSFKNIFFIGIVGLISHPCLSDVHQERHDFHYRIRVLSKADIFPPFGAVGVADDRQIAHYSNEFEEWISVSLPEFGGTEPLVEPYEPRNWYKDLLYTLSNCTDSQCSELHTFQRIIGCKLENLPDGSVNRTVFDEYGFDGEDFISFNSDTMKWIDKNPKAKETKEKWNSQKERNQFLNHYLKNCLHWISTYNNTNKSSPDVHISASKAADDQNNLVLSCLATGFYPRDVQMYIRLDRTKLENQTSSGLRPNEDETFQMRVSVKIDRNYKGSYDCQVIHNSLTKPATAKWDGKCSNCEPDSPCHVITGAVAAAVFLGLVLALGIRWYINKNKTQSNGTTVPVQVQMTSAGEIQSGL